MLCSSGVVNNQVDCVVYYGQTTRSAGTLATIGQDPSHNPKSTARYLAAAPVAEPPHGIARSLERRPAL